jgi:tetratricopeptide (TPR) repeat protein
MIARSGTVVGLVALLWFASAGRARADANDEARAYLERAKAAFALSHYAQAAEYFEKAFELKSDRALLFNAAQSHRLAGNKERALALYQNYLRVYGNDEKSAQIAQIEQRIEELKRAIEHDRKEMPASPPPGWPGGVPPKGPAARTPAPGATAAPLEPPNPQAAAPGSAAVEPLASRAGSSAPPLALNAADTQPAGGAAPVLTKSASPGEAESTPLTRKPWFWIAVGGGVAAAVVTVLFITMSKTNDPSPSFGTAHGN